MYTDQFDITFNGFKSKVIVFGMRCLRLNGELVPCLNEIVYLGLVIGTNSRDTHFESVNLNSKFNSCMANLGFTSSVIKNKLYFKNIVGYFMAIRIVPYITKILKDYMSQVEKH